MALFYLVVSTALAARGADTPYDIFDKAKAYWQAQRYPANIAYDVVVRVSQGGVAKEERYAGRFSARTGGVDIDPVSDYERANPPDGRGVKLCLLGCFTPPSTAAVDFIGVPKLGPVYSFGISRFIPQTDDKPDDMALVRQIRDEFHDPNPYPTPVPTQDPSKPIATVVAHNREYDIALAGTETVNGVGCYHLTLKPLRDAGAHRLRDVWIDEATYATVRANVALNFVSGPGTTMPWTIDFADVDGRHYVASETMHGTWTQYKHAYDSVVVTFEHIRNTDPPLPYQHEFTAPDILTEPPA